MAWQSRLRLSQRAALGTIFANVRGAVAALAALSRGYACQKLLVELPQLFDDILNLLVSRFAVGNAYRTQITIGLDAAEARQCIGNDCRSKQIDQ